MSQITQKIDHAIADLLSGKPVAIPTETVYGLAALIDQEQAIKAVFHMKQRPLNHPLIVHVATNWDLSQIVEEIPEYAKRLISAFWPGPLTLVFKSKENAINPIITGNQSTVAIRCPNHPLAQQLLKALDTPVVAPSANSFGKVSPTTAAHVHHSFPSDDLIILDGGRCEIGIESTIVDATKIEGYQILRHGMIDAQAIAEIALMPCLNQDNSIRVPGKLDTHYQPQKRLYYFEDINQLSDFCHQKPDVYVIASKQPATVSNEYFHVFATNPEQAAFDLYYQLREADHSNADCIAIELPPHTSKWQGIRERILKAGCAYA